MESAEKIVRELLEPLNITINGSKPGDVQVHNNQVYQRILKDGALGAGESYMEGWWDATNLDVLFQKITHANVDARVKKSKQLLFKIFLNKIINFQNKSRAFIVGKKHYDLGINLFKAMLDSRMTYTCGYWKNARNLEEAQLAKLELTCQKLLLKPGMRVLDIGCGFGGLAKYMAEKYGVDVVGITISKEQFEYALHTCQGLPVQIRFQDYRDVNEKFDRVVSLGMFEHVGFLNYNTYMQVAHSVLEKDGIFLLHTIGNNIAELPNTWISTYIFPNGMLPSASLITKATEPYFVMEDWHNFGADYDKTLMAWQHNFEKHWDELKSHYDERFHRMWNYYLLSCAGTFRARKMQLWQIVFSKEGLKGGYQAPRAVRIAEEVYPDYAIDL